MDVWATVDGKVIDLPEWTGNIEFNNPTIKPVEQYPSRWARRGYLSFCEQEIKNDGEIVLTGITPLVYVTRSVWQTIRSKGVVNAIHP